jgi:hypothetical protein
MNVRRYDERLVFAVALAQGGIADGSASRKANVPPTANALPRGIPFMYGDIRTEANLKGLLHYRCRFVSRGESTASVRGILFTTTRGDYAVGQWTWDARVSAPIDGRYGLRIINQTPEKGIGTGVGNVAVQQYDGFDGDDPPGCLVTSKHGLIRGIVWKVSSSESNHV